MPNIGDVVVWNGMAWVPAILIPGPRGPGGGCGGQGPPGPPGPSGGGGPPTGPAGGDLAGTYPNPTVDGLQGTPVAAGVPTTGDILIFDGTNWIPETPIDLWDDVDADINSAADAYVTIVSIPIVLVRPMQMQATALWSVTIAPGGNASFGIFVDGVMARASDHSTSNLTASGGVSWRETIAALGAHTINLRWRNIGGAGAGLFIRPVTNPTLESASLRVECFD